MIWRRFSRPLAGPPNSPNPAIPETPGLAKLHRKHLLEGLTTAKVCCSLDSLDKRKSEAECVVTGTGLSCSQCRVQNTAWAGATGATRSRTCRSLGCTCEEQRLRTKSQERDELVTCSQECIETDIQGRFFPHSARTAVHHSPTSAESLKASDSNRTRSVISSSLLMLSMSMSACVTKSYHCSCKDH